MNTYLSALTLAALMASSSAVFAQDATDAAPAESTTEQAETAAPAADAPAADAPATEAPATGALADQLDTGEEADAAQSQTYVREKIGDWDMQCLRVEEGEEPCQMYQLLTDGQGNSVAEVSLFRVKDGGQVEAGGTFVVPLETLLTQKMSISVDGGQPKRYDFTLCNPIGCYARVGFTADDVNRFKRGKVAKITIVPALAPDQKVTVDMSLTGFTDGYSKTSELAN
ncbi:invasion associated locus B family protein [Primorskyibacter flagellatus]|uniref:Invasion protein IalB, involved in pathogenesis n=1 Tax=Primorskyibacter flagellatus TaxID=1387277 RepID=A0A1W1Z656_9RHOB|nr:invasion associated locus B family protein [Primorskyibacter flagellatus]SMC43930.1 Invasion protein IalB, involved in pathogenesis [Primorskyibacter flagellatus]